MKNITVSIPDETYRRARILAAERGSSVSSLVADYLVSLDQVEARFERLEALQDEVLASIVEFSAADRLSRDEIHERALR